jgi:hypothetical protein
MDIGGALSTDRATPGKQIEYRRRAAECRELAHDVRNEGSRQELLHLAEIWMSLADTRHAPSP